MAEAGESQSVRNSTGKLKAKASPNYLRASTGSCHDHCKYGTPHEFKPKPKRPVRRTSTSNTEIPIEIFTPSVKTTSKAVKPTSVSPPTASLSPNLEEAAVVSRRSSTSESVRQQQGSSSTKVKSSHVSKQIGKKSSMSPDLSKLAKQESPVSQKNSSDVKPSLIPSFLKKGSSSSQRQSSTSTSKSTIQDAQSRRMSSLSVTSKPTRYSDHLIPGSSSKTTFTGRKPSSLDTSKSVKRLSAPSTVKAPLKKNDTSTKLAGSSLKPKLPVKPRKSLASSSVALTPNLPGTKVARLNVKSKITKKPEASSSSKKPEIPEKTLHMIEMESNNQQSPGSFDSLCQSKSAFSSQDAVETESGSECTDSEVSSYRRGSGKGRVMESGSSGVKLNFRRGKEVDPEYEANNSKRIGYRGKSVAEDDLSVENEMKVVLRHQDVQEKRSEQGLLNDVIEEKASKLKEMRKSKVKALVGAFESVISLQESKPSPSLSPGR